MIDFALETKVDFIEFQVIDIVPGKTDFLALTDKEAEYVLNELKKLKEREDYFDTLIGTEHLKNLDIKQRQELLEFGRFFKHTLSKDFIMKFEDGEVICPMGEHSIRIEADQTKEEAFKFYFSKEKCDKCKYYDKCTINKKDYSVKEEFLNLLGFGSFQRRLLNTVYKRKYDSNIVDSLPCYVGWIYSRILANGDVIPCCKAHLFSLGNLYKNSFKEIWFSNKYNEFRSKAKKLKKSDPYFNKINCYKGCDNLGMNLEMHRRINSLNFYDKIKLSTVLKIKKLSYKY